MNKTTVGSGLHLAPWLLSLAAMTATAEVPRVLDDRLVLELVAEAPQIVTPVGLTFDHRGRLLVIESHTHFPPKDYPGPKTDRIRILEDTDGDGRADRFRSFLEGTQKTMSLRRGPDDWIYVATRMRVFRVRDSDGDGKADKEEPIARLQTDGNYPHNGLCGLCFDDKGNLYFGLGENLGKSYEIIGSDGKRFRGGGEGGNIYRCRIDGSNLEQVATGFWNPFGICLDTAGRLFTVGNDPDASPPCRLVHVVPGGDYGYQFRYGRSGKHPLQAWDGELPGTLPMAAGTSEAPSSVVLWHGQLYVSSWGEYRVERFTLKQKGASVTADREIVAQGDHQFRPIDFTIGPDGALYFTDWVDRSYNVHRQGRVWRLRWKKPPSSPIQVPALSASERRAAQASKTADWEALASRDPFLHHAAMMGLRNSAAISLASFKSKKDSRQRLGILEAARRSKLSSPQRDALIREALNDLHADVRLYAVRWIADEKLVQFRSLLDRLLSQPGSAVLFKASLAAADWLDTGRVDRKKIIGEQRLVAALIDNQHPALQAIALKTLPGDHAALKPDALARMIANTEVTLLARQEAAKTLTASPVAGAQQQRLQLASQASLPDAIRADLLSGVSLQQPGAKKALTSLTRSRSRVLRQEAERRLENKPTNKQPAAEKTDAWLELTKSKGNADVGWRVFFGQGVVRCANCHRYDGRGADVGPDLTGIGRRVERRRLLQSILQPSQEISPRYVPWNVQTEAGKVFSGMSLGVRNDLETFLTADGKQLKIPQAQIEERKLSPKSIMPDGLHQQLRASDIRDLLALLRQ